MAQRGRVSLTDHQRKVRKTVWISAAGAIVLVSVVGLAGLCCRSPMTSTSHSQRRPRRRRPLRSRQNLGPWLTHPLPNWAGRPSRSRLTRAPMGRRRDRRVDL